MATSAATCSDMRQDNQNMHHHNYVMVPYMYFYHNLVLNMVSVLGTYTTLPRSNICPPSKPTLPGMQGTTESLPVPIIIVTTFLKGVTYNNLREYETQNEICLTNLFARPLTCFNTQQN